MKLNPIVLGIFGMYISTLNHAAALDQSGQTILPFLENGNYVEVNATAVDPDISGTIRNRPELVNDPNNLNSGNMGNSFHYYSAALKLQLTEKLVLVYSMTNHLARIFAIRCNPIIPSRIMNILSKEHRSMLILKVLA